MPLQIACHGTTSSESILTAQINRSAGKPLGRPAISRMDGSRGQRVLGAPAQLGGWSQEESKTSETASLEK
jgi:hypothetical protein